MALGYWQLASFNTFNMNCTNPELSDVPVGIVVVGGGGILSLAPVNISGLGS